MNTSASASPYESLFLRPSITTMLGLSGKEFEKFVAYVFQQAGFLVNNVSLKILRGVDLELNDPQNLRRRLGGIEVKRHTNPIELRDVAKLLGARSLSNGKIPGYLVTTSDFTKPAYESARGRNVQLINGKRLERYINYVRESTYEQVIPHNNTIAPNYFSRADEIITYKTTKTKVIAIANNKGGVGKSTTARYLARGLAALGKRVLIIDMDPQANLSEALLNIQAADMSSPYLTEYFAGKRTLLQTLYHAPVAANMWLIPAHPSLGKLDSGGFGRPLFELQFVEDLYRTFTNVAMGQANTFDWIVIDTPPAISLFTRIALASANYVLAPVRARPSSDTGTANMINSLKTMGALLGKSPKLIGGLVTHWGKDTTSQDSLASLKNLFNLNESQLFTTKIPFDVTIEKKENRRVSPADAAYGKLIEEVLNLCQ